MSVNYHKVKSGVSLTPDFGSGNGSDVAFSATLNVEVSMNSPTQPNGSDVSQPTKMDDPMAEMDVSMN